MREIIASAMKTALKEKDQVGLSTIRLISAALKDRDIAARSSDNNEGISDDEILSMLQTMIKQRNESVKMYEQGNRPELAAAEKAEIAIIQQFLPAQLSAEDVASAIADAIAETGANSVRDMGKVMACLKEKYAGQLDFTAASQNVKSALMN
ncbi:MAG: Uncharacterised protein [Alphaproteobacteria bacterium UBA4588]|jgi:uncharacterized protein YqeY|nr:MAG: Uncharacterised protein [Alphaproteobacteria bacterium UBA4588]